MAMLEVAVEMLEVSVKIGEVSGEMLVRGSC